MTESEAIKELHEIRPRGGIIPQKRAEAIDVAINALEKQIPKKPEYEAEGYADGELVYDYAKCPICGHDFEYGINDLGCKYCSDCGQKLNWESDADETD